MNQRIYIYIPNNINLSKKQQQQQKNQSNSSNNFNLKGDAYGTETVWLSLGLFDIHVTTVLRRNAPLCTGNE